MVRAWSAIARVMAWRIRPGRVGGELVALAIVELLDRADQADIAFLDQVEHRHAATDVLLGHRHDESEVGLGQTLLGQIGVFLEHADVSFAAQRDRLQLVVEIWRARHQVFDPARRTQQMADMAVIEDVGHDRDLDEPFFGARLVVFLVLSLETIDQRLAEIRIHLLVDSLAEVAVFGQVEQREVRLADLLGDDRNLGQQRFELKEQEDGDLERVRVASVEDPPLLLKVADPVALFHLPGEVSLVLRSEQIDAPDLTQVHAYGIVDSLGFLMDALATFFAHFDDASGTDFLGPAVQVDIRRLWGRGLRFASTSASALRLRAASTTPTGRLGFRFRPGPKWTLQHAQQFAERVDLFRRFLASQGEAGDRGMGDLPLLVHFRLVAPLGRFLRRRRRLGRLLGGPLGLFGEVDRAPSRGHGELVDRGRQRADAGFLFGFGDGARLALPRRFGGHPTVAELVADQSTQVADDVIRDFGLTRANGERRCGRRRVWIAGSGCRSVRSGTGRSRFCCRSDAVRGRRRGRGRNRV